MTTAPGSRANGNRTTVVAIVLAALASAPVFAHRLDEYLQASRIAVEPDCVELELDLTPGVSVTPRVLAEIDRDGNGWIDSQEARVYAARVSSEIRVDLDGRTLPLQLTNREYPTIDAMRQGEGAIRLQWTAATPRLAAGSHRLTYRNVHRADIGVYLVNALVPASHRVTIRGQRRDVDQRELVVEYELAADRSDPVAWWIPTGALGAFVIAGLVLRDRLIGLGDLVNRQP